MIKGVVGEGYIGKLLLIMLGIIIVGNVFSTLFLYTNVNFPLSSHFGALHFNVNQLRETLIPTTVKINLLFFLFIVYGVVVLGIFRSHRVAGPLYKVTQFAKVASEGKFGQKLYFRKKDAIQDFASTINKVMDGYRSRTDTLLSQLTEIEDALKLLISLSEGSKEEDEQLKRIRELNDKLKERIHKIKL